MIGAPLSVGLFTEVLPIAPRPRVAAPLLMERVLPERRSPLATAEFERVRDLAAALPAPWQRLVDSESSRFDQHLVTERFVGVTVRDVSHALRSHGRVLPLDVLRACVDAVLHGLAALDALAGPGVRQGHFVMSDAGLGLGVDGRWRFAHRALNHWFAEALPPDLAHDPERRPTPDATLDFASPEFVSGLPDVPASHATRAALFAWQLATGGFHPYRRPWAAGQRAASSESLLERLGRYHRSEPAAPLELHPELPRAVQEVLRRGVHFSGGRFADVAAFGAALDAAWSVAPASPARVQAVLFGLAWPSLQRQLEGLKQAPLLPIRWDGVWSAARTPEEGLAVLEDQLLERLASTDALPRAAPLAAPPTPTVVPLAQPEVEAPAPRTTEGPGPTRPPVGLLRRLLGRVRR